MPTNVFVSFDHNDQEQVASFKALSKNPNHTLVFHDRSLKKPVTDRAGKPLPYPPNDPRSEPVRKEIKIMFNTATKMVVLVGHSTHKSDWVNWEIRTFYDRKKSLPGRTRERIRAMKIKDCESAVLPPALTGRSTRPMNWNPEETGRWFDENPVG